jgi:hypothetical protein
MALFAEINPITKEVLRVIVADDVSWPQSRLGGAWVETTDAAPLVEQYAGIGMFDGTGVVPRRFVSEWRQPLGSEDAYPVGAWVWHNGQAWESLTPANVWEPGVSGWRDPINEWPDWIQPTGAQDAYPLGAKVTHNGQRWVSGFAANVWEPGVFGWTAEP